MDMNLLQAKLLKLIEDEESKAVKNNKFILDCIFRKKERYFTMNICVKCGELRVVEI